MHKFNKKSQTALGIISIFDDSDINWKIYSIVTAANTPFPTSKNNPSLNTNHAINIHKSRNDKSKCVQVMNDPKSNPP